MLPLRRVTKAGKTLWICMLLLLGACTGGCDTNRVPLVSETDDEAANFGRTALIDAVVQLSKSPESAQAYAKFSSRVDELMPFFNREVKREAELRICVLAIAPLRAGFNKSQAEQMEAFATTVWPAVLQVPTRPGENAQEYVARLCQGELALDCHNVVPQYWPVILNARVWRSLKSRVDVAYDRCSWCADDPSFADVLNTSRESHLKVETLARNAQEVGRPSSWPTAGKNGSPLMTDLVVSFGQDGWVTIQGQTAQGGNWRQAIESRRESHSLIALHLRPQRLVGELLEVMRDVDAAGYERVALVTRQRAFPYDAMQYVTNAKRRSYRDLGVHNSDTIQILVQALDLQALKRAGRNL